jgi:ABC-type transport system involved in cytochrome c biogenesis permease subunit
MMRALGWLSLLGLVVGLAASFGYAPREVVQGNVQRIMYLHVPAVLTAYLAFALVFVGSVGYLLTRRPDWDRLALAAAEPGVLFTGITIASGSIWGKPTWGTWWTWDARLTSTAVLFLVYVGYLPAARAKDRDTISATPKETEVKVHRVLVVEDEQAVRDYLVDFLTELGHHVESAGSGSEALSLLDERSYALILTDLRMPDTDGEGLYQKIAQTWPHWHPAWSL